MFDPTLVRLRRCSSTSGLGLGLFLATLLLLFAAAAAVLDSGEPVNLNTEVICCPTATPSSSISVATTWR